MKKGDCLFKKEIELEDLRVLHNQLKSEQRKLLVSQSKSAAKDQGLRISSNESDDELQQLLIRQ